jgi:hypothetical protein
MRKISKEEYDELIKREPMKVKRTKKGYYHLGKNKWISKGKDKDKELRSKYED